MKVTIIGGGTAGWLTALFFQKFGNHSVTVLDSSRVGILGAGEASTPNFQGLLVNLGISEREFLNKTKAAMKFANDFINWSPNGGMYSHKFDMPHLPEIRSKLLHGFHFDARECADYFKSIGLERGIIHLDVNVTTLSQNDKGDVNKIHTEEGIDVDTEFVIDCSGLARIGAGKLYNSKWTSYSKYLKANSAIAYFLPQENGITNVSRTATNSIAMKYGWMWQAPLQHRWGCGYVYNDTYITAEDAKKEIEEYVGREIDVVKTFKFEPGSFETPWNNNCVSMGLASGFLEPLEGTSIMTLILSIYKLGNIGLDNFNDIDARNHYNAYVNDVNYQCMLFVRHHYNCGRLDTDYWRDINSLEMPIELSNILDKLYDIKDDKELLEIINPKSESPIFGLYNYQIVKHGHKNKTINTLI